MRAVRHQLVDTVTEVADAFGLGLFAISGASLAMVGGMPALVSVLLGAVTAASGGAKERTSFSVSRPRAIGPIGPSRDAVFQGVALTKLVAALMGVIDPM